MKIIMENKNFEQMMEELTQIVEALEKGNLSLDDAVKMYQKGMDLSLEIKKRLEEAKEVVVNKMNN